MSEQRPLQFYTYTPRNTQEKTERRKHASIRNPAAQKSPHYKMQKTSKNVVMENLVTSKDL